MTGYKSKLAAAQDKITDEQGRPMTYWGGKAQPAQAPVAWMYDWYCDGKLITGWIAHSESEIPKSMAFNIRPLYTAPPQCPWLEPTGNEWFEWWRVSNVAHETEVEIDFADFLIIAQAVVAKLKEKNNGA